jgi:hypothetical protein
MDRQGGGRHQPAIEAGPGDDALAIKQAYTRGNALRRSLNARHWCLLPFLLPCLLKSAGRLSLDGRQHNALVVQTYPPVVFASFLLQSLDVAQHFPAGFAGSFVE